MFLVFWIVFLLCVLCPMLPVSVGCQFLIVTSVFSYFYLSQRYKIRIAKTVDCTCSSSTQTSNTSPLNSYFLDIKSVQRYTNEPVEWDRNSPNVYVYELDRDFQH